VNYAEGLVYWYLRLNGFFPITNFVLHATGRPRSPYSADCDLLAIRPAGVYEPIGGGAADWDRQRFAEWDVNPDRDDAVLMVEVKSGACTKAKADKAFGKERCEMALHRAGHQGGANTEGLVDRFYSKKSVRTNVGVVAKLLVVEKRRPQPADRWFHMTLNDVDRFLVNRMEHYREKYSDRMFFPDAIAQYLAWKSGGLERAGHGRRQGGRGNRQL
jgi:hypothetical protein